jgi:PIN domain nuclease of toxin-antitoxin system
MASLDDFELGRALALSLESARQEAQERDAIEQAVIESLVAEERARQDQINTDHALAVSLAGDNHRPVGYDRVQAAAAGQRPRQAVTADHRLRPQQAAAAAALVRRDQYQRRWGHGARA